MTSDDYFDERMDPRLRRVVIALVISAVAVVALVALVTALDASKHPTLVSTIDAIFAPGYSVAKMLISPGHDFGYLVGVPLVALAFSVVFYGILVWTILSLPDWWRNRP